MNRLLCAIIVLGLASASVAMAAQPAMLFPENLKTMGCAAPDTKFMFVRGSQPGNVFYPDDPVSLTIKVTRGEEALKSVTLNVIEIATRQNKYLKGQVVMGDAFAIENLGPCGKLDVLVTVDDKPNATAEVEVKELLVPPRYGTYAVIISPNGKNPQFLCTLLRANKPKEGVDVNAPVFGEGQFLTADKQQPELVKLRAQTYSRLGIKGARMEIGWAEQKQGTYDWQRLDVLMDNSAAAGIKFLITQGGHPSWTMPFGQPTPACIPQKADYSCMPKYYDDFGRWIKAFCERYWKNGDGALWAIEHWNEPWEGISISGWESDMRHYRELMKRISDNAKAVDPRIKTAAACSIMNTEDKFFTGEDRKEMAKLVDLFTDHYVPPRTSYGPMVAKYWGKESTDTESWMASTEVMLPQMVTQFLACGQDRVTPWHPAMIYFAVPGSPMSYQMPTPVALATNVFNAFIAGRPFNKMLFQEHLPWAFQFGKDDDAVVVFFGRLMGVPGSTERDALWWQYQMQDGGTITIDNGDGELEFYDIAGNREFKGENQITLPMDYIAHYIKAPKGGAKVIAERLRSARIEGVRPVEIIARDFTAPVDAPGAKVNVTIHNLLNRPIEGKLAIAAPEGITLKTAEPLVKLAAGKSVDVAAEIAQAKASPSNAYLFGYSFTGEGAKADWKEMVHVLLAKKASKTIDGSLDDWANDFGVMVDAKLQKVDPTEQAWMPFLQARDAQPDGSFAEVKTAWDDKYFYVAARVNDPTDYAGHQRMETWDEDQYFRSAKDDAICETLRPFEKFVMADMNKKDVADKMKADPQWPDYEKFLKDNPHAQQAVFTNAARVYLGTKKKNPAATFADGSYVYKKTSRSEMAWAGDCLQIGLDVLPDYAYNLKLDNDRVPWGFHAMPDTDYEYSAYQCTDGKAELWRILAPGVPRGHYAPRQPRAKLDQGAVPKSQQVVKRDGKTTIYEIAIPWTELNKWKPRAGETFGFTFRIGNDKGPALEFGADKSATKTNGLSLHPYWLGKPSCSVRWALGK